jgi:hypothetical protein
MRHSRTATAMAIKVFPVSRCFQIENFLEKRDMEKPGGDAAI